MGLAAMLAESSMQSVDGANDIEDTLADDAASVKGDGTKDEEGMETDDNAQNTIPPTLHSSQLSDTDVAGNAGSDTAADGSSPTEASEQPPPGKAVVGAHVGTRVIALLPPRPSATKRGTGINGNGGNSPTGTQIGGPHPKWG